MKICICENTKINFDLDEVFTKCSQLVNLLIGHPVRLHLVIVIILLVIVRVMFVLDYVYGDEVLKT